VRPARAALAAGTAAGLAAVLALSACAQPLAVPSLAAVQDERSVTMTAAWVRAAAATEEYIARDWPEAEYPPLRFERWVEAEEAIPATLACMDDLLGRPAGTVSTSGIFTPAPRPEGEPSWQLPVAQLRCQVQLIPWTGLYPFGGPVEQEWVRHQLTVALPACVRQWGAELVIADLDRAVDASIFPTSSGREVVATQSVWLAAELRGADAATEARIRAQCPDPGRTLAQLDPAEIRSIDVGPAGSGGSP
jgi:hypothetical protein